MSTDTAAIQAQSKRSPADGPRLHYAPAIDGLRAVAVLAVLLYHGEINAFVGGFLGVEVFFTISGYLITSLLLAERAQSGDVDLPGFWFRRARRLLPAVFLLLLAVLTYAVIFLPDEVARLRSDALASAAYVTNWYLIYSQQSYFQAVGRPSLLRHLWSLAVEEQFYVLWPLIFTVAMRLWRPAYVLGGILIGVILSTALMAALYQPNIDPSRVYYGTDARAAGLLVGAALAFVWKPGASHRRADRLPLDAIGFAALGVLTFWMLSLGEFSPFLYRGGFLLLALTTAVLIAVAVSPKAQRLPALLSLRVLRYIGTRSYGIYLWHWPVYMLTRPQLDVALTGLPLLAVRLLLTFGLAELSYRFVESPIRHGALGHAWANLRTANGPMRRRMGLSWLSATVAAIVFLVVLGGSVAQAQPPAPPPYLAVTSIDTLAIARTATPAPLTASPTAQAQSTTSTPAPTATPPPTATPQAPWLAELPQSWEVELPARPLQEPDRHANTIAHVHARAHIHARAHRHTGRRSHGR